MTHFVLVDNKQNARRPPNDSVTQLAGGGQINFASHCHGVISKSKTREVILLQVK